MTLRFTTSPMKLKGVLLTGVRKMLAFFAAVWLLLWVVSLWYCHHAYVGDSRGTSGVAFDARLTPGSLELTGIRSVKDPGRTALGLNAFYKVFRWADAPYVARHQSWVMGGFGLHTWQATVTSNGPKYTNYYFGVALPFWLLALLCAIWPALHWMPRQVRCRRAKAGLCPTCGYDVRATPDRCPECGTEAAPSAALAFAACRRHSPPSNGGPFKAARTRGSDTSVSSGGG